METTDTPPKRRRRSKKAQAPAPAAPKQEWPACDVCGRTDSFTHRMYKYVGERVLRRQVCQDCAAKDRTLFDRVGAQGTATPNRTERRAHLHQHANQRGVYRAKATAGAATPHAHRH